MRCIPHTPDVDDGTLRVTRATGERGQWYLWNDDGDVSDVSGEYDRLQLTGEHIKTDKIVTLEDCR